MPVIQTPLKLDRKAVDIRVADWTARLNKLYGRLDAWMQGVPHATVTRGTIKKVLGPPGKRSLAATYSIPTYSVFVDQKRRISFLPGDLWIVGANGRIDISAPASWHQMADLGGREGAPSDWQLAVDVGAKFLIPFNKTAFRKLLGEK